MSVDEPHLVPVSLGDSGDQVAHVAQGGADGGARLPGPEPGLDLQLLLSGGLVLHKLEVQIQMLEVPAELPSRTFDLDHLSLHLDGDAVRDVHSLRGQNRLHFSSFAVSLKLTHTHTPSTNPNPRKAAI